MFTHVLSYFVYMENMRKEIISVDFSPSASVSVCVSYFFDICIANTCVCIMTQILHIQEKTLLFLNDFLSHHRKQDYRKSLYTTLFHTY